MKNLPEDLIQKFREKFVIKINVGGEPEWMSKYSPDDVEPFLSEVYQRGREDELNTVEAELIMHAEKFARLDEEGVREVINSCRSIINSKEGEV